MAGLRKASSYSKRIVRPYTRRAGTRKKAFIKAIPPSKIVKFSMGDQKGYNTGKFKFSISFISDENIQVRDNALESCRTLLNKALDKKLPGQYFLHINVYPHHILRENKTAAGAGADRLSSGMKHSFGVTIGRATIVTPGKTLFMIAILDEKGVREARKIMTTVKPKMPCRGKVVFKKLG